MRDFLRDETGEFNYVRWILVILAVAAGYWGWKYGPGMMQQINMQSVANKCAALQNVKPDHVVKPEIVRLAGAEAGVAIAENQIFTDRSGAIKTCKIQWEYRNTHVWGGAIVKKYEIDGESTVR